MLACRVYIETCSHWLEQIARDGLSRCGINNYATLACYSEVGSNCAGYGWNHQAWCQCNRLHCRQRFLCLWQIGRVSVFMPWFTLVGNVVQANIIRAQSSKSIRSFRIINLTYISCAVFGTTITYSHTPRAQGGSLGQNSKACTRVQASSITKQRTFSRPMLSAREVIDSKNKTSRIRAHRRKAIARGLELTLTCRNSTGPKKKNKERTPIGRHEGFPNAVLHYPSQRRCAANDNCQASPLVTYKSPSGPCWEEMSLSRHTNQP